MEIRRQDMDTEVRTIKASERRSWAKYLVLILVVVVCFLLFMIHKANGVNNRLVRRKSLLLDRLRTLNEAEEQTVSKLKAVTLELEEHKTKLDATTKEKEASKTKVQELTKSYDEKVKELDEVRKTATEAQNSLDTLRNQLRNESSTVLPTENAQ